MRPRALPPLPYGFTWRPCSDGGGDLILWGVSEMATVRPTQEGRWLVAVNVAFHDSLHREAVAISKGQACYWVHRWASREADWIYRARPEHSAQILSNLGAYSIPRA